MSTNLTSKNLSGEALLNALRAQETQWRGRFLKALMATPKSRRGEFHRKSRLGLSDLTYRIWTLEKSLKLGRGQAVPT